MYQTVETAHRGKSKKLSHLPEISGETPIWFGRHQGKPLKHIPHDYLLWLLFNVRNLNPGLKRWIATHKQHFSTQAYLAQ